MTKQATIGTVSHGTMRLEDLIPAFLDELRRLAGKEAMEAWPYATHVRECEDVLALLEESEDPSTEDYEAANLCVEWLFETLGEYAPPFCYFGAHEGDGADYGFWPDFDAMECEGIPRVENASELPDGYVGRWLLVNDHGNATLFTRITAPEDVCAWEIV